jgi:preprotein translocase subunit YajC
MVTDFSQQYSFTLAQASNGAAGLPGETTKMPEPGAIGAGNGTSGGASPRPAGFDPILMFVLLGAILLMFVFSFSGQRKERKKREAMLSAIKKHDRVQTAGGIIGAIVELKPEYVVLKVDESANTRITFARSAIQQVLTSSDADAPRSGEAQRPAD